MTSELNQAFRIPCASTSANVQESLPSIVASIRAVASNFSVTSNYERTGRETERQGRSQSHKILSTHNIAEPSVFYKDICLLGCAEWEKVPCGEVKADLMWKNLYIDAWPVAKNWNEATLRQESFWMCPEKLKWQ